MKLNTNPVIIWPESSESHYNSKQFFNLRPLFPIFHSASLPGYPVSITVGNAIKNRASNEVILAILKELPNPNQDEDDGQFLLYSDASLLAALVRPNEKNQAFHHREEVKLGPTDCFQQTNSVVLFLFFFQMRVKVLTLWRSMSSSRLCSVWPLNPSATPSVPSESRFRFLEQQSFWARSKLPCGFSRFHEILKTLTDSDEGRLHILKVVYDVWRNHPQVRAELASHQQPLESHVGVRTCDACSLPYRWLQSWLTKWSGRRSRTAPL